MFLGASCLCTTQLHADISVKPAGMQVVWDDGTEHFEFKTMNSKPGVVMTVMLDTDGDPFISLDQNASKITVGGAKANCWFFGSQGLSKDAKHLRVKLDAPGAKLKGGKVAIEGELVVKTAKGKGSLETGMIDWKKGGKVEFPKGSGLPVFTIDKIGKPDWGDEKWEVTLKTNQDFEKFVSIKFVDEKGKELEAKRGGWSRMGMMGKVSVTVSYKVKIPVLKAKMVVEYWKNVKNVKVPVKFSVGIDGK